MNDSSWQRSPLLMSRGDTGLLVIDVQEKLLPLIPGREKLIWNIRRLLDGAKILGLPAAATEQYPQGLGPTTPELAKRLGGIPSKIGFSCSSCPGVISNLRFRGISKVLVAGMETHVCVQQTVYDLLAERFLVYVAVDAVAARYEIDHATALRRLDSAGAVLTTTEAALFEWCQASGTPEFKQISQLVRETAPE